MVVIKLENVNKIFDPDVHVLKDIELEINDKEFMVLVGPSGCGKSTCLNIIAGLEYVTDGRVFFDDVEVTHVPPKERRVAMVFQSYALYPHMNVRENMAFALKIDKKGKEEIARRVENAAELLGISELLERKPGELSGGQRQRVALGRSIVRNPTVFLFDEPLSNLDAKLRIQMRGEIIKLQKQLKITQVYVTHDQVEAMSMADRIAILNDGKFQQIGTPTEVYNTPQNLFVAGFIGSPTMNFIDVMFNERNGNTLEFADFTFELTNELAEKIKNLDSAPLVLGIRPEHIKITPEPHEKSFEVNVSVVEYLGPETLVTIDLSEGVSALAAPTGFYPVKMGEKTHISFPKEKIYVFNRDTGENILFKSEISK
ncbi:MAG: sn-glycerol-3-phosphate ABC transporter ATP-binding protein UgpC [Candidatus Lokiarchaeota archaeon]|nr:sn-glycerol-3-phosphate ABC transporter ATP-binding protein UgpC [Candidatus Lokiarchaeota archaeon]